MKDGWHFKPRRISRQMVQPSTSIIRHCKKWMVVFQLWNHFLSILGMKKFPNMFCTQVKGTQISQNKVETTSCFCSELLWDIWVFLTCVQNVFGNLQISLLTLIDFGLQKFLHIFITTYEALHNKADNKLE